MTDEPRRVEDALAEGTARLAAAGVSAPRREAVRLWEAMHTAKEPRALLDREARLSPDDASRFVGLIARRTAGEPEAHVSGVAGFRRLLLRSDRRALIPRPETEGLVQLVLAEAPRGRVADVGTGTGCIALALADEGAYDQVTGVDYSGEALALARANALATALPVRYLQGDLCTPFGESTLDVLVSNPPYLSIAEYDALDGSVREWEPGLALVSGADGLAATRRLLQDGRRVVRRGGLVALELDSSRAALSAALARDLGWCAVTITKDLFGRERFLTARRDDTP